MGRIDPSSQLYDDADCDSWNVPGRLSTGPCDPAWKGDYDRAGCIFRVYGADDQDCDGPEQDHHDGHTPDPMPPPEGEPCGYELRHLEAVRRRWPGAVHIFRGRGSWRRWTIVWFDVRTTINLARRQTSVDLGGIGFSSAAPASWFGRDGPAAMVRDLDRALFEHRLPWLLWVPPSADPWRTWDGETRYGETWIGDVDHVVYVDHGGGVVGCSTWMPLTGRSVGAFPTEKDCDALRCALSGPIYTPCTYADCDVELGGGCTPWLVVKLGPEVPAGVLRLACLRCGDTNDTALPVKASDLTRLHDRFKARHKGCKEQEP